MSDDGYTIDHVQKGRRDAVAICRAKDRYPSTKIYEDMRTISKALRCSVLMMANGWTIEMATREQLLDLRKTIDKALAAGDVPTKP